MFTYLTTKNFRKLRDHRFEFSAGLNAIRGLNEHGKSTLFEAIGYALLGSGALRETLDDVVSWGEKTATLSVELGWVVNGQELRVTRAKSGAELYLGGKLEVTGQTEVTRFCERMLGADAKLAPKLMLASQASLRGALAEGPTAATQLIEQLANFSLVDQIIELVTSNLPTGSVTQFDRQIADLDAQLAGPAPVLNVATLEAKIVELTKRLEYLQGQHATVLTDLEAARVRARQARADKSALTGLLGRATSLSATVQSAQQRLAALPEGKPDGRLEEALAAAERRVSEEAAYSRAARIHAAWTLISVPEDVWEGDRKSLDAEMVSANNKMLTAAAARAQAWEAMVNARAQVITETACGLCGKDLRNVPEVQTKNTAALKAAALAEALVAEAEKETNEAREYLRVLNDLAGIDNQLKAIVDRCQDPLFEVDQGWVPAKLRWIGPVIGEGSSPQADSKPEVARLQAEIRAQQQAAAQRTAQEQALAEAQAALAALEPQIFALQEKDKSYSAAIGLETDLGNAERQVTSDIDKTKSDIALENSQINMQRSLHNEVVKARQAAEATRQRLLDNVAEIGRNNVLLKKLRLARPKVADKLWNVVLSAVSHYFSQGRGVQSLVTKDDDGFRIDGRPIKGFSGSTLDALGLAVRIALTKTFMPNNDFLILDEPGAACDDEREANFLGLVASCGFEQVLLVTHSSQADAFADNMIVL